MIAFSGALFLTISFCILFYAFGLLDVSRKILRKGSETLEILQNPLLGDRDKQAALRKDALIFTGLAFRLLIFCALALLLPYGVVIVVDRLSPLDAEATLRALVSPAFLFFLAACLILYFLLRPRKKPANHSYSGVEQLFFRLGFLSLPVQTILARIEDHRLNEGDGDTDGPAGPPVFITSLPRAGTTLLLNLLAKTPQFASHTYRDLPFLFCPVLWRSLSARFMARGNPRPRIHGDGITIDYDSPEAFEEMIWSYFFPKQYRRRGIRLWPDSVPASFARFFSSHINKICHLAHSGTSSPTPRYLSKNNFNISRILALKRLFPESIILVPFRNPRSHCRSLFEQHRHFSTLHDEDLFIRFFMRAIGHYDFGKDLRPINFDDWLRNEALPDPLHSPDFWLHYWCATFQYLLNRKELVSFLNFDRLQEEPRASLETLGSLLGEDVRGELLLQTSTIRPPKAAVSNDLDFDASLLSRSEVIYRELKEAAIR